jgi:hypothetical protein
MEVMLMKRKQALFHLGGVLLAAGLFTAISSPWWVFAALIAISLPSIVTLGLAERWA